MLIFSFLAYTSLVAIFFIIGLLIYSYFFDLEPKINEHEKVCIVTGASSGIGYEICRQMVNKGWMVIGIARREQKLKEAAQTFGPGFSYYVCDLTCLQRVQEVCQDIKIKKLEPTLFFLDAGISKMDVKFDFSSKVHRETFDTNYFGAIYWIDLWLNEVKNYGGGTFVAMSSVMGFFGMPGFASYASSKAAIKICFQSLRLQYKNDKIGFCTVFPGPVDTVLLAGQGLSKLPFKHKPEYEAKYIVEKVLNGRKKIEPSIAYSFLMRFLNFMPDKLFLKIYKTHVRKNS